MKKITIILAIITILFSLALTNISNAAVADVKNISVNSVSGKVGDKVTVNITASADLAIEDDGLLLKYDKTKLKFISATDATIANLMLMSNDRDDGFIVAMVATGANKTPITKGTVLSSVVFEILEAASGNVALELVHEASGTAITTAKATVTKPVTSVTLDKSSVTLEKGETVSLVPTITPADHTEGTQVSKWESSDPQVATVDNTGKIKAVRSGTATITYTFNNFTKTCKVNVNTTLTGIKLNETKKEILKGQELELKVVTIPEDANNLPETKWETSDANVATVTNGKVTAIKAGTVKIKATVGTFEAECEVTVKEIPLTDITLSHTELKLVEGNSATVTITSVPENTTDKITKTTWVSSDEKIATVKDGKITAVKAGKATISVNVNEKFTKQVVVTVEAKKTPVEPEKTPAIPGGSGQGEAIPEPKPVLPQTGDIAIEVFVGLMIVSVLGISIILIRKNKIKNK